MITQARKDEKKKLQTTEKLNEDEALVEINKLLNEVFEEFSNSQLSPSQKKSTDKLDSDGQSTTLNKVQQAFIDLISRIGSDKEPAQETLTQFDQLVD